MDTSNLAGGNDLALPSSSTSNVTSVPVGDVISRLYPNVNEQETPLPRKWGTVHSWLALDNDNLRVTYKGKGKLQKDAASVRAAHSIPASCGIYYYEVKIVSKGHKGYIGIGLSRGHVKLNGLPGWSKNSYGYHGDDGHSFYSSDNDNPRRANRGLKYGPKYTTGDIIGCCLNLIDKTCFYTKNGANLGIAHRDMPSDLYPTVGLNSPLECVEANFGQERFEFDIHNYVKEWHASTRQAIERPPSRTDVHSNQPATLNKTSRPLNEMNAFKEIVVCKFAGCNQVYNDPRILPCGKRTCAAHINEMMIKHDGGGGADSHITIRCQFCHKIHSCSIEGDNGFLVDDNITLLLNMKHGREHDAAKKSFDEVTRLLANVTTFDSERYVIDYFVEVEAGILQEKEVNLQKLLDHYRDLVDDVHQRKVQCLQKLTTCTTLERELEAIKRKLAEHEDKLKREQLDFILKTLDGDEDTWKAIQSECDLMQEAVKSLEDELKKKIVCNDVSSSRRTLSPVQLNETISRQHDACIAIDSTIVDTDEMKSDLVKLCKLSGKQFELIYRATRDGFQADSFHARCDYRPSTLTIIKTTKGHVFGGYTSVAWDSTSDDKDDPHAFIFSLLSAVAQPMLIPIKAGGKRAIRCVGKHGPIFGRGHDIYVADMPNKCKASYASLGCSYDFTRFPYSSQGAKTFLAGTRRFDTSEIEVFLVN